MTKHTPFLICLLVFGGAVTGTVWARSDSPNSTMEGKVRYRAGKEINFDNQIIEGGIQRSNGSVITGDEKEPDTSLFKLRDNFLDRIAIDGAEDAQ